MRLLSTNRLIGAILIFVFVVAAAGVFGQTGDQKQASTSIDQAWDEMFQQSQKEKKGLTFYIKGETVSGIVTRVIGKEAVEVRNQTFSKVIIRMESIDAIAIN